MESKNCSERPRTPRSPALAGALRAESLDFAGTFSLETRRRLRSGPRYAPRAGGAHDSHHRTAGIAGRTRRRGCHMAARGARAAAEGADHRRAGYWQYQAGRILAGVSAGTTRSGVYRGAEHLI